MTCKFVWEASWKSGMNIYWRLLRHNYSWVSPSLCLDIDPRVSHGEYQSQDDNASGLTTLRTMTVTSLLLSPMSDRVEQHHRKQQNLWNNNIIHKPFIRVLLLYIGSRNSVVALFFSLFYNNYYDWNYYLCYVYVTILFTLCKFYIITWIWILKLLSFDLTSFSVWWCL